MGKHLAYLRRSRIPVRSCSGKKRERKGRKEKTEQKIKRNIFFCQRVCRLVDSADDLVDKRLERVLEYRASMRRWKEGRKAGGVRGVRGGVSSWSILTIGPILFLQ